MDSTLVAILVAALTAAYGARIAVAFFSARRARIVICPETRKPAAVTLDAGHSAVGSALNSPDLQLWACSRWPERAGCNQACVSQMVCEPRATLASERVRTWLSGKTCARCERSFEEWHAIGPQPGLLCLESDVTTRWDDVPARQLPARLETDAPVCRHCQLFEDVRRQHPDRIGDRHRAAVN